MDEVSALMRDRWQIAKLAKLGLLHRCRRRVGPDGSAFKRTVFELRSRCYAGTDKSYYVKSRFIPACCLSLIYATTLNRRYRRARKNR